MLTLKQSTMLGNVPEDWDVKPLKSMLQFDAPGDWGDDGGPHMVRVLRSTNLTNERRLDLSDIAIRALKPEKTEKLALRKGDILLERSGGGPDQPVGRVGYVAVDLPEHAFSNFLHLLRPDAAIDPSFLSWVLYRVNRTGRILRLEQQTTQMRNLNFRDYLAMPLPVPSPDEQAAIARVLDAVEAAIDRAGEAVEQSKKARLAVMQAAFHYEMTDEPKHDTEAGRIPQSWEALKGKQAFSVLTGGSSSVYALKPLRGDDKADAWFMKVDDFNHPANARRIATTQIGFVSAKNPSFKLLPLGTVIIAKRGAAILKNRVRTTAVPIALDPNLMALKVRDDILPEFFRYQLEWRNLARYVESSGVPQLNNKDLYPRWFVRAPDEQQKEIVAIVSAAEQREDSLRGKLRALETLKKSLMHELLTGAVRVNPSLLQTDATI
ncbi:restriction endonuclease subunit S [Mesorhizobium qingshengii]|uniref:Restriction endonuclease subunit S n=1 Tax=Mesorhizobium qingshengii TaxID=1165689 RepID=A0ABT4QXK8_9HYPH|nr:restriction endonuclease subunit S [Mesorhizobium qingshengii]MCZ8546308.1 restriction endonuclease subunit S [Mesorhizobium qingshengii]